MGIIKPITSAEENSSQPIQPNNYYGGPYCRNRKIEYFYSSTGVKLTKRVTVSNHSTKGFTRIVCLTRISTVNYVSDNSKAANGFRLGRWNVPDPANQYASPYVGMGNNPATRVDPDGREDNLSRYWRAAIYAKAENYWKTQKRDYDAQNSWYGRGDYIGEPLYGWTATVYSDGTGGRPIMVASMGGGTTLIAGGEFANGSSLTHYDSAPHINAQGEYGYWVQVKGAIRYYLNIGGEVVGVWGSAATCIWSNSYQPDSYDFGGKFTSATIDNHGIALLSPQMQAVEAIAGGFNGGLHDGYKYIDHTVKYAADGKSAAQLTREAKATEETMTRSLSKIGTGLAIADVLLSGAEFVSSDMSGEEVARLTSSLIITGIGFIPLVGAPTSMVLGVLDSFGVFDSFYKKFE